MRTALQLATMVITVISGGYGFGDDSSKDRPLFMNLKYHDARDVIATRPRKFSRDDPSWQPQVQKRGRHSGETSVIVRFPVSAKAFPVRFGIPLEQVPSAENVAVFDEHGRTVDADVFPLVNFETSPRNWVLICTVLDAFCSGDNRKLTIRWGPEVHRPAPKVSLMAKTVHGRITVSGGKVTFTLSPQKLLSDIRWAKGSHIFASSGSEMNFKLNGKDLQQRQPGKIQLLYDGPFYKRYRIASKIVDNFVHHFEVECWGGSPYLMISSRLINESNTVYKLSDLRMFSVASSGQGYAVSAAGVSGNALSGKTKIVVSQRVDDWSIRTDGLESDKGTEDVLGEWVRTSRGRESLTLVVPDFQGFGPADPDLESHLSAFSDGRLELVHYCPYPPKTNGTITFWDTMARTFRMVLHAGDVSSSADSIAGPVHQMPSVKWDRTFLTAQGVFNEEQVTHVYDERSLEGTRYFNRTRAHRHDYPRMGRAMPIQDDGVGGSYTDTGGMLFGEVWQYTCSWEGYDYGSINNRCKNLPKWYKPKSMIGTETYRCGDHSLAMALSYLRTGDREVFGIFRDHPLLYADWAIAHPEGYCHYYTGSWHGDNHVYVRLGGPIMSYLVDGDPWLLEVAEQMGGHLVRSWNGKVGPRDTQTRSAYPARGLCWLYEVTGHRSYWNNAVDLSIWVMQTGMEPDGGMRGFQEGTGYPRISELYAGYTMLGLIPVYERCGNKALLKAIRKCGDWLLTRQAGHRNMTAGTWGRDTVLRERRAQGKGGGNSGSTTLCAEILTFLAQETGRQEYFYSGAAAWANLVATSRQGGVKGGIPMQATDPVMIGTWSDTFAIYLHRLPAVAERRQWAFVIEGVYDGSKELQSDSAWAWRKAKDIESKRKYPVVVFVGAGGSFKNQAFKQPIYAVNIDRVTLSVWCPSRPGKATYEGTKLPLKYDAETKIAEVTLPPDSRPGFLEIAF